MSSSTTTLDNSNSSHDHNNHHDHPPAKGIMRWITTTNHKDIGTMYLLFSLTMFFVGGFFAMVIRGELHSPGLQYVTTEFFNQAIGLHGLIMVFGAIMPAFVGFANWMIPMMIGSSDMAFARINNWSFWILPFAAALLVISIFVPGGSINSGWTMYAPLSVQQAGMGMDLVIFAVHILGISSIMGSINIIVTILNLRAPKMKMMQIPIFCWCWLVTAFLLIAVMPVLAGAVTMLLFDRHFGTSFFSAAGGGDPMLFQHIFWFFGHPEVYIIALPAFGVISQVFPVFARKKLFGYTSMVYAIAAIAILSFIVWAHHMYTTGLTLNAQLFFMYATILIAVPTGVKVFNWLATIWRGSITLETPMLFALGFLFLFVIGGFSGLIIALVPLNVVLHGTYYIVAHFHYTMVAGALFSAFAGLYMWLPKWTGRMYNETLGKIHFWLSFIFFNMTFFVQHFLGMQGMPRRIADYPLQYQTLNQISTLGSILFGLAQLLFLYILFSTIKSGAKTTEAKTWEGAEGLEWTLPSPVPYHTFEVPPVYK